MFNDLPLELQGEIASYLNTPHLCFFAQTSKRSLQAVLPLLKARQKTLLCPPQWRMTGSNISIGYTSLALYACGNNGYGQLGLGDKNHRRTTFTRVRDLPGTIQQVIAGGIHTLVLTSQGLYACGHNGYGQLGLGDKNDRTTFTAIACLPSELKQRLALYRQIETLITLGESNIPDTQQRVMPLIKRQRRL